MDSTYLNWIAWIALISGIVSAIAIVVDIFSGRRQSMKIMEITWPVTGLYMGPLGWWAYVRFGRAQKVGTSDHGDHEDKPKKPFWQSVFVSVTHCGGGCTIGDIISDTGLYLSGLVLFGSSLLTSYTFDFALAFIIGILFQYLPIRAMGETSRWRALVKAVKADALSLISFEIGLFGWMALVQLVWFAPGLNAADPLFWFMMQVGMTVGFITAYPTNWWLVRKGIKHGM
ncbi:DUF4396 domain-containing protein [Acidihalobacter ferrooxydans]|uniref:DUF4396 domain-containing protein n=1 Tax=Acidihalobacter ferrooxydans TaxID=1765967 RepID=A0A1P8UFS8_9GAMM|nr:DUF4396 domain-containing protein [Acidihalobacter ferrooxydans]APZ42697.1 hypothetical protein BW247_05950 [Acidihalobacter ferrooxydans]